MLVTFEDMKRLYGMPYLKDSDMDQYNNLLLTAEEEVLEYAGLELDEDAVEYFEGNGARKFVLLRKPVCEVTDVLVGGQSVEYRFDTRSRCVTLSRPAYSEVEVHEGLGFDKVPLIIKKAIAECVQYWAKYLNSNMVGVTSRSTDLGTETLEQYEIPLAVKTALDRFRNVVV